MKTLLRIRRCLACDRVQARGATIGEASATRKCLSLRGLLVVRIRLDHRKSVRPFKGIFCNDVSEFESYMPSQAVPSLRGIPSLQKYMRHPRGLARRHGVSDIQFSEFRPQTRAFMGQPVRVCTRV